MSGISMQTATVLMCGSLYDSDQTANEGSTRLAMIMTCKPLVLLIV